MQVKTYPSDVIFEFDSLDELRRFDEKYVKNTPSKIINNIKNDLIYTYHNNYRDYLVIPFSNPIIVDYLQDYENVYNNYSSIIKSNDERISLVPLSSS